MSTKVDITLTTTCSQGLTFYMPVVSRDLSSHSWGSIAIGQHHAIGQVRKHIALIHRCLQILVNCPYYISVQEKDGRVLALGRSEYGRLGLGDGENITNSIDANNLRLIVCSNSTSSPQELATPQRQLK